MKEQILDRGAEAILIHKAGSLIKRRIKKSYRLGDLDEKIRKRRSKREAKLLEKAGKVIFTPKNIELNEKTKEISMDFLDGKKLSDHLDTLDNAEDICKQIGEQTAKMHDANIIHGDLTTSNMIFHNNKVYFIDFGLGFESNKIEDKAVDLHLIKQALEAKHHKNHIKFFKAVKSGYKLSKDHSSTLKRLEAVEKRGRYKKQY